MPQRIPRAVDVVGDLLMNLVAGLGRGAAMRVNHGFLAAISPRVEGMINRVQASILHTAGSLISWATVSRGAALPLSGLELVPSPVADVRCRQ